MTGIVGVIDSEGVNPDLLKEMSKSITYRKSLRTDKYIDDRIGIAIVRKKSENQPVFEKKKGLYVFLDGDVFDYEKDMMFLKGRGHEFRTDTQAEFCLHSYEEKGEGFVKGLNGRFIIAIIDLAKDKVLILNDRMGAKPFYYFKDGGKLLFASEMKAILQDSRVKREVDEEAVANFFAFEKILGNRTLIKNVHVLPHASVLKIGKNGFELRKYWDMDFKESYEESLGYYVKKLVSSLERAIERRFSGNPHFTLSGGLDTRLILSVTGKKHERLNTFTIGGVSNDQTRIAGEIAEEMKTRHSLVPINDKKLPESIERGVYMTDGMCSCRHFALFSSVGEIVKGRDVIISGAGLGELLGDYFIDKSCLGLHGDKEIANYCCDYLNYLIKEKEMPLLFSRSYFKKIREKAHESIEREIAEAKGHAKNPANVVYYFLFKNSLRHVLFYAEFPGINLNAKLPSTDADFLDFALRIPPELRLGRSLEYETIRRESPALSKIAYNQTGFPVEYDQLYHKMGLGAKKSESCKRIVGEMKKKDGRIIIPDRIEYVDMSSRLRENAGFMNFFKTILFDKKALSRPYFNHKYVKQLFAEHVLGRRDNTGKLCALLTFELWHRFFIDGEQFQGGERIDHVAEKQ